MLEVSYFVAFGAGVLSFLSPCVLPLVPAYLANLAGASAMNANVRTSYRPAALWHSLSFIAGFSIVFIALGISAGLFGGSIVIPTSLLNKIAGAIITAFGLFLITAFYLPWLNYEKRLRPFWGNNPSYIRSLIIGAVFSLGWTPCVGPILGAILTLALSSQTVWYGASLLAVYSLGMGIPFILVGLVFSAITPLWKNLNRYSGIISLVSGLLLITLGVLMFTDNLSWFSELARGEMIYE